MKSLQDEGVMIYRYLVVSVVGGRPAGVVGRIDGYATRAEAMDRATEARRRRAPSPRIKRIRIDLSGG